MKIVLWYLKIPKILCYVNNITNIIDRYKTNINISQIISMIYSLYRIFYLLLLIRLNKLIIIIIIEFEFESRVYIVVNSV